MCDSLGKKDFSKLGLAAIVCHEELTISGGNRREHWKEAAERAKSSDLLNLKRAELEGLAAKAKSEHVSWGYYACYSSQQFKYWEDRGWF